MYIDPKLTYSIGYMVFDLYRWKTIYMKLYLYVNDERKNESWMYASTATNLLKFSQFVCFHLIKSNSRDTLVPLLRCKVCIKVGSLLVKSMASLAWPLLCVARRSSIFLFLSACLCFVSAWQSCINLAATNIKQARYSKKWCLICLRCLSFGVLSKNVHSYLAS